MWRTVSPEVPPGDGDGHDRKSHRGPVVVTVLDGLANWHRVAWSLEHALRDAGGELHARRRRRWEYGLADPERGR